MSKVMQQALEEAIEARDKTIDKLKGKLNTARNALYGGMVFINNQCKSIGGQREIYENLHKAHQDTE